MVIRSHDHFRIFSQVKLSFSILQTDKILIAIKLFLIFTFFLTYKVNLQVLSPKNSKHHSPFKDSKLVVVRTNKEKGILSKHLWPLMEKCCFILILDWTERYVCRKSLVISIALYNLPSIEDKMTIYLKTQTHGFSSFCFLFLRFTSLPCSPMQPLPGSFHCSLGASFSSTYMIC